MRQFPSLLFLFLFFSLIFLGALWASWIYAMGLTAVWEMVSSLLLQIFFFPYFSIFFCWWQWEYPTNVALRGYPTAARISGLLDFLSIFCSVLWVSVEISLSSKSFLSCIQLLMCPFFKIVILTRVRENLSLDLIRFLWWGRMLEIFFMFVGQLSLYFKRCLLILLVNLLIRLFDLCFFLVFRSLSPSYIQDNPLWAVTRAMSWSQPRYSSTHG